MNVDKPAEDKATLFVNPGLACMGSGGSFADITILSRGNCAAAGATSAAERSAVQMVQWSRTKQQ